MSHILLDGFCATYFLRSMGVSLSLDALFISFLRKAEPSPPLLVLAHVIVHWEGLCCFLWPWLFNW